MATIVSLDRFQAQSNEEMSIYAVRERHNMPESRPIFCAGPAGRSDFLRSALMSTGLLSLPQVLQWHAHAAPTQGEKNAH